MTENSVRLAYLLGALYGDGCFYHKDRGRIIFASSDKEFTVRVASIIKTLFGLKINIRIDKLSKKNKNWKDSYVFSSRPLYRNLKDYRFIGMPKFVEHDTKETKAAFISGFFDAEGNVDIHLIKKRNELQRHLRCFNNNLDMLKEIQEILKEFSIKSWIGTGKGKNWCLTIWGYHSLTKFQKFIGFKINRKALLLEQAIRSYKEIQIRWSREIYETVIKLRKTGLGATRIKYCLNLNVPKPTIESWIYGGVNNGRKAG